MKNKSHSHKQSTKAMYKEYIIEYAGLPVGEHLFEFDVDNEFMQQYQSQPLENTFQIHVSIYLMKYNHSLQARVSLKGHISVICDRCLAPYSMPVQYDTQVLIEKGNPENSTDEILMVEEHDNKINLSQYLYESIYLLLPFKIVPCEMFDADICDTDILKKINQNLSEQNKSTTFAELFKNKFNQ